MNWDKSEKKYIRNPDFSEQLPCLFAYTFLCNI